jgi:type I restriction enzyme S subunit
MKKRKKRVWRNCEPKAKRGSAAGFMWLRLTNDNLSKLESLYYEINFKHMTVHRGNCTELAFEKILTLSSEKSNDSTLPAFSVTNEGIFPRSQKFKKNLSSANSKNKIIRKGDLVFGMSRDVLNWGVMEDEIGVVSPAYTVFHIGESVAYQYVKSYISNNICYFKDIIKPASREGQGIDKERLLSKKILIPEKDILRNYLKTLDDLRKAKKHIDKESQTLVSLRNSVLSHYF